MLARFRVLLPYSFSIPYHDYAMLKAQELLCDEYRVKIYPPQMANVDSTLTDVTSPIPLMDAVNELEEATVITPIAAIKINGQEVVQANLLQLDLVAARDFARDRTSTGVFDPPLEIFFRLANSVIARLKSVGRMSKIKFIDLDSAAAWKIEYLADTGQALPQDQALYRGTTGHKLSWQISAMPLGLWELALTLPVDFTPPIWHNLILDAKAQLPEVNASIVLASAALESFIKLSLDTLAKRASIPADSWSWINNRDDVLQKQPSTKERFDQVLFLLTGKSLRREQPQLWKELDNLRIARNSLVHEGKAVTKKKTRKTTTTTDVTPEIASVMVDNAARIIAWVESLLPPEHRRLMFTDNIDCSFSRPATGPENATTELVGIRGDLSKLKLRFGDDELT